MVEEKNGLKKTDLLPRRFQITLMAILKPKILMKI